MRSLYNYICEQYSTKQIKDLTVKFKINTEDLIIEVPKEYMEDKIQTYLDDIIINKLFVGVDYSKDMLGKNYNNIADAYFEYSGINVTSGGKPNLEFDTHYDDKASDELHKMKLSDFTFVVEFDKFDIQIENTEDEEEIKNALIKIFEMCVSDEKEWPINLILDKDSIQYTN